MSDDTPELNIAEDGISDLAFDSGLRDVYAENAASTRKLPYSDIPVNSPPGFQDFVTNLNTDAIRYDPRHRIEHNPAKVIEVVKAEQDQLYKRRQMCRELIEAGYDVTVDTLDEFIASHPQYITDYVPPDAGQYEPPPFQRTEPRIPAGRFYPDKPLTGTTAVATRGEGVDQKDATPPHIRDEIIANLIAGRSCPYIQRLLRGKYSFSATSSLIRGHKHAEPWATMIIEGRKLRYDAIRSEGMALVDERIITLQHNAEQLQLRIDELMSTGGVPPLSMMKELRETLNDIAQELGHRRKGIDLDNNMMLSVIRGPQKAASAAAWETTAIELDEQKQLEHTDEIDEPSRPTN